MATRSTINLKQDGKYFSIYCHWDGYPSHNGVILANHYTTKDKVNELIALGNLSILDKNIGVNLEGNDKDTRDRNMQCLAYGRDLKEKGEQAQVNTTPDYSQQFAYVFENDIWKCYDSTQKEVKIPGYNPGLPDASKDIEKTAELGGALDEEMSRMLQIAGIKK